MYPIESIMLFEHYSMNRQGIFSQQSHDSVIIFVISLINSGEDLRLICHNNQHRPFLSAVRLTKAVTHSRGSRRQQWNKLCRRIQAAAKKANSYYSDARHNKSRKAMVNQCLKCCWISYSCACLKILYACREQSIQHKVIEDRFLQSGTRPPSG